MADIKIDGGVYSNFSSIGRRCGIFWKSTTVGYIIFIDSSLDLKYRKTSDGGASWAAVVNIKTGTIYQVDCWADWQTAGDTGTKINIAYMDFTTNTFRYVYLDTASDTVGGDDQIEACQGTGTFGGYGYLSLTKSRGGNIAVAFWYTDSTDASWFYMFYTSPDADTWTSKTTPLEDSDWIQLYAGNEADNQDLWAAYWDKSANEISLKTFDNSGNSWSEQSISGSMTDSAYYLLMDGQIRLSDGHLIFAAWNLFDSAAADLMVWDINGAGSITAKTNVITNESETFLVSVFIDQVTDDIYITYVSGTAAESLVACFYQKSTDGGTNWSGETAMQADAEDDERWVSAGCIKSDWGGKFEPVWFNDDLDDLFCNSDNGVTITGTGTTASPALTGGRVASKLIMSGAI